MRPNALKANRTFTPLETSEFLLELAGLAVELGVEEVEVSGGTEELKVTPCALSETG
jgi:hypothetical protein